MPIDNVRVIEIVSRVAPHTETFHNTSRAFVADSGHGDDFGKTDRREPERDCCSGPFGCVTVAPRLKGESVSEFDARHEGGVKRWHRQTDEPDERRPADDFDGPQPEAAPLKVVADVFHRIGAFLVRLHRRKELADSRIGVQCGERFKILGAPLPEPEACCREHARIVRQRIGDWSRTQPK